MTGSLDPRLVAAIADVLDAGSTTSIADVMAGLRSRHVRSSRREVDAALAGHDAFVAIGQGIHARWQLDPAIALETRRGIVDEAPPVDVGDPLAALQLRRWQVEAFAAWAGTGCRGVVEAVTGSGKTRLAVAAVRVALSRGGRVLVIVPTLDLVEQWAKELRRWVPDARIGRLGGGQEDDLHSHHVVIATPHSASAVPIDLPPGALGLIVADEAHRYGAPTWGAALHDCFHMRLALTATYERNDDGIEDILGPYFGGVVHSYSFADAKADGVIAPFRITFVLTALEGEERVTYDAADRRAKELYGALTGSHGLPRDPRRTIAAAAQIIAEGSAGGPAGRAKLQAAAGWMAALRERRETAAQAAGKLDVVRLLAPQLEGRRTLMFSDTIDQAELAARMLARNGRTAEVVHGELKREKRRIRLAQFANGNLEVLGAPRVLDEGVDVPEADVAIVLAAFRTRRQMIQRLGRVLRLKDDGRQAELIIVCATDTREDPARGGHQDFMKEIVDIAEEIRTIDADREPAGWCIM